MKLLCVESILSVRNLLESGLTRYSALYWQFLFINEAINALEGLLGGLKLMQLKSGGVKILTIIILFDRTLFFYYLFHFYLFFSLCLMKDETFIVSLIH